MKISKAKDIILSNDENSKLNLDFIKLYGKDSKVLENQKQRYINALEKFSKLYPNSQEIEIYSASGRTEIGGNHTDHQHGCVLAAAVNLDVIGIVSFHNEKVIRVKSEGYDAFEVELSDLSVKKDETGSAAIIRGIASKFASFGVEVSGFDMYSTSDVLCGSGISSSAAFETLVGTIIDIHYNEGKAGAVEIAKIGQYAENVYFGKNSGLMDQMVSSVGGLVSIDFNNTEKPLIKNFNFDFESKGYSICVTDTKGSHANLTGDYVAIRNEMEQVAAFFGKSYLRQVEEKDFYENISKIRKTCSDRAVIRATHFFDDNNRAIQEANALMNDDLKRFLKLVQESGDSSATLLQNLYSLSSPTKQEIPLAIMMSKKILNGKGAVRVHGGGFAGTIQAFVPKEVEAEYISQMNNIFGEGSCHKLRIRPVGGTKINLE